jgi:hypothetical protein
MKHIEDEGTSHESVTVRQKQTVADTGKGKEKFGKGRNASTHNKTYVGEKTGGEYEIIS